MAGLAMNSTHSSSLGAFSRETHHCSLPCRSPLTSSLHFFKGKEIVRNKPHLVSCKLSGTELEEPVKKLKQTQNKKRVPFRPGRISGPLAVPAGIPKHSYVGSAELPELSRSFQIHNSEGISGIKAACQLAARALDFAGTLIRPLVMTNEIDKAVHQMITKSGAKYRIETRCPFTSRFS